MLIDMLLALGMVATASSQMRLGSLPIGPGEICLVVWIPMKVVREMVHRGSAMTIALIRLIFFWSVFALALAIGTLYGLFSGEPYELSWFLHDVMAYPLIAAVSCLTTTGAATGESLRRTAWFITLLGAVSLLLQISNGLGLVNLPGLEPWFWERFRGWSDNPNQLALACVILALLSMDLADTTSGALLKAVASGCACLAVIVGVMTRSDTFILSLGLGGAVYIAVKIRTWLESSAGRITVRAAFAQLTIVSALLLAVSALPFSYAVSTEAQKAALNLSKNDAVGVAQEADLRVELWRQALWRGLNSGMLGLGPGPHLEIPALIVAGRTNTMTDPGNTVHPEQNGTSNFEAHNTVLDLFTQGGLLGTGAFLWLALTAVRRAYAARSAGLTTLVAGTLLFGMTGLIVRQPIVWFVIAICLNARPKAMTTLRSLSGRTRHPAGQQRPTALIGVRQTVRGTQSHA